MKFPNKRGFSIVEVLVACMFVTIIALSGLTSFTYFRNLNNRSKDVCKAHVAGVVERFRSIGHYQVIDYFVPTASNKVFGGSPSYSLSPLGISDTNLWPSLDVVGSTAAPVVNNSVLVASSINALLAIYNTNPAYCSTGAAYTPPGPPADWITKPSSELTGAQLNIQIVPYNTATGVPIGCPFPLRVSPEGRYSDADINSAFGQSPKKANRGTGWFQAGLLVRVVERFTSEDGIPTSCSVDQRFQYSADLSAPSAPNFTLLEKISGPTWESNCTSANNEYSVTFGYGGAVQIEPGGVMLCRDNSIIIKNPDTQYTMATCSGAGAPAGQVVGYGNAPYYPSAGWPASFLSTYTPNVRVTGLTYDTAYAIRAADTSSGWVPCHMVTACGIAPSSAGLAADSTPQQPKYKLTYQNLPPLCRVNIAAAALDTAANSSINTQMASKAADPSQFDDTKLMVTWDIPMPRCGEACGSCGKECGISLSTIYFKCGGC